MSSNNDDGIIRNPNRSLVDKPKKYVPEYIRLDKTPEVKNVNPTDFLFKKGPKKDPKSTELPKPTENDDDKLPANGLVFGFDDIPNIVKKDYDPEDLPDPTQNNIADYQAWRDRRANAFVALEEEAHRKKIEEDYSNYDDFPPNHGIGASNKVAPEPKLAPELMDDIVALSESEYAILVCGKFIASSSSKDEIEQILHQILFEDSRFSDINREDVTLLKKIPLRIGVLVAE